MIVAVDYDGTLIPNHVFPATAKLVPGALEFMHKLRNAGVTIIIWTCREYEPLEDCLISLIEQEVPFDYVNAPDVTHLEEHGFRDTRKVYADLYVDDRGIAGLPTWDQCWERVQQEMEYLKTNKFTKYEDKSKLTSTAASTLVISAKSN